MRYTRKKQKSRIFIACFLLLTMMPFFFVKAFHVHEESSSISHDKEQGTHHSEENCAICLFSLSLFTEAETLEYNHILTSSLVEHPLREEKDVTVFLIFQSLRAPPYLYL